MPDAFEFPRMLRAVVPLMRCQWSGFRVVREFVALRLGHALGRGRRFAGRRAGLEPSFAAVVGALDDLSKPAARLRTVDSVWFDRRTLQMIDLPAGEMRTADVPFLAL